MNHQGSTKTAGAIIPRPRSLIWHELGLVSLLIMEVSWITPWFRSFWPDDISLSTLQVLLLLLGHGLVALNLGKLARHPTMAGGVRTIMLLGSMVLGVYASLRMIVYPHLTGGLRVLALDMLLSFAKVFSSPSPALILIVAILYVWRRSVLLSSSFVLGPTTGALRFRLGVLFLALFALVHRDEKAGMLLEVLPVYFGAGLLGMALGRADSLTLARGASQSPFSGGWLVAVVSIVAAIVALGGGLGVLLSTQAAQSLAGILAIVLVALAVAVLSPVLLGLYFAFSYIVGWLMTVWPTQGPFQESMESVEALDSMLEGLRQEAGKQQPAFMAWLREHSSELTIILTSLAVLILAFLSVRVGRRYLRLRKQAEEDEAESLFSASEMADDVRRRIQELRDRLGGQRPLKSFQRLITASTVRRIYTRLMALAHKAGCGREASETPLEFLGKLIDLFPDHKSEVTTITHAYVQVRYGEFPEDEIDLKRVREGWAAIRKAADARPVVKDGG